ncbi:MAG: hypothetical protein ACPHO8_07095 [Mariniblastus sp.]
MRLKQIVVVILGIVILVVSQISVAWSQANLSLLEHGSNNQCYAEAKAFSMDWGNGIFDEDSEDSTDKNRANALALVDGAFAITTSRAYGGANKYDVEALRVWATGKFTAEASGTNGNWLVADGGVPDVSGSSHHWAKVRVNRNSTPEGPWGLPFGWKYVIEGNFSLELEGDRVQWAGVKGPGIDLRMENISGEPVLWGTVENVIHDLDAGHHTVQKETYRGRMPKNMPSTFSAVVTPDVAFEIWAGGSAGIYSEDWASNHLNLNFNYEGSGKGTIEITNVKGVPPAKQESGENNGGYGGSGDYGY